MHSDHGKIQALNDSEIKTRILGLGGFVFDVDGVFTDNRVLEGSDAKPKFRSYYDGQGVSLLRAIGIKVCLITNEKEESARHISDVVTKWNNLPSSKSRLVGGWKDVSLYQGYGGERKVEAAEIWLKENSLTWNDCGVMGDDLVDLPLLLKSKFLAAPSSAEKYIRDRVNFISLRPGGYGAVRDLANFILDIHGVDPGSLPPQ